ncbi:MAG: hypothetical protein J6S71_04175 [Clostridia bacterium]|nr:hypothetical protein [Clostridia bacterium]
MVDLVFSYIVKAILIIASCFLYVFLVSTILPALFLTSKRKNEESKDRGIKKYVFDQGRAIVYTPEPNTQKYISQYILSENNGERFLKCKFDNRVVTANYEVTVFNSSDKVIDVINVYDTPDCKETARAVPLPLSAAYVNISVNEVNQQKTTTQKNESVSFASYVLYIILTFAATVAISLLINAAAIHIADLCLSFTERMGNPGILFPIISALIISAFYTAITIKKHRNSD